MITLCLRIHLYSKNVYTHVWSQAQQRRSAERRRLVRKRRSGASLHSMPLLAVNNSLKIYIGSQSYYPALVSAFFFVYSLSYALLPTLTQLVRQYFSSPHSFKIRSINSLSVLTFFFFSLLLDFRRF